MSDRDNDAATVDDARALMDAFIGNEWSSVVIRLDGRAFSFSRVIASGGLDASGQGSEAVTEVATAAVSVTAPHVGTVTSLAGIGAVIAKGEAIASLSVLDEVIEISAPSDGTVISHGTATGALVEFRQVLIELAS